MLVFIENLSCLEVAPDIGFLSSLCGTFVKEILFHIIWKLQEKNKNNQVLYSRLCSNHRICCIWDLTCREDLKKLRFVFFLVCFSLYFKVKRVRVHLAMPDYCAFFFFFFCFLGPYLWHMAVAVPRLGVKLELQLPACITAMAMWDPSCICDQYHNSQQSRIHDPLSEARDRTYILMNPIWICFLCGTTELLITVI